MTYFAFDIAEVINGVENKDKEIFEYPEHKKNDKSFLAAFMLNAAYLNTRDHYLDNDYLEDIIEGYQTFVENNRDNKTLKTLGLDQHSIETIKHLKTNVFTALDDELKYLVLEGETSTVIISNPREISDEQAEA